MEKTMQTLANSVKEEDVVHGGNADGDIKIF